MAVEILTFNQLEAQGIQLLSPGILLFKQKKFRLGPAFGKHCQRAALDFCRIVQAEYLMVEHSNYFSIWLHYHKQNKVKTTSQAKVASSTLPNTIDTEFIQSVQAALIDLVGPIGQLFIQKTLQNPECQTPLSFIELLAATIPNQEKAKLFRTKFIPQR